LKESRDIVIEKTDEVYYMILEKMMEPQMKRVYFHQIDAMLNNIYTDKYTIKECDTFNENMNYYHDVCRNTISEDFFSNDPSIYYKIIDAYDSLDHESNDYENSYVKAADILAGVLATMHNIELSVAKFFANTMCIYPNDSSMEEWIEQSSIESTNKSINKSTNNSTNRTTNNSTNRLTNRLTNRSTKKSKYVLTYKDLNKETIRLCQFNVQLNYHLLTCDECMRDIKRILRPEVIDLNDSDSTSDSNSKKDSLRKTTRSMSYNKTNVVTKTISANFKKKNGKNTIKSSIRVSKQ
jgi:hypothetical protein